jgi:hypothetical protein
MAVADTRIMRAPGNVLTEHGPKLLPITVACQQPGDTGFFNREVYRADVGFAYSGATLSALAAHALSNTLLSKLVGNPNAPPPPLTEVAYFIGGASAHYMREVGQLAGADGLFSAIIFGWCPEQQRLRLFQLLPRMEGYPLSVDVTERVLQPISLKGAATQSTIIIGTDPNLLENEIDNELRGARERGEINEIVSFDAPKRALRRLIRQGANEMVGGSIQQARVSQHGFEIISNLEPIEPQAPSTRNAGLFVLGFDTLDLRAVGHYQVAVEGR